MVRPSRFRILLAVGTAIAALAVSITPVAAARELKTTGDIGSFDEDNFRDQFGGPYGANCIYKTGGSDDLDRITIRAPINVHGLATDPAYSKVEWRFKIRRNAPGAPDSFQRIHTSSWQTDRANHLYPADGFTRRAWNAPNNPSGFYQVLIEVRFWYQGSPDGFTRWQYVHYKTKRGGASDSSMEYCLSTYF